MEPKYTSLKLKDAKKDPYTCSWMLSKIFYYGHKCFFMAKTSGKLFKVTKFYMQSCAASTSVLNRLNVQQFTPNKYLIVYHTLTIYIQYTELPSGN